MAKTLEDFYPFVTVHVVGCSYPLIDHAIRQSAIAFCQRSLAWNGTLDAETLTADDLPYRIAGEETYAVVHDILNVFVDDKRMSKSNARKLDKRGNWRAEVGIPEAYVVLSNDVIDLWRRPEESVSVIATVVYNPKQDTNSLPDILYNEYAEMIAAGARARLMAIPNKPWSDAAMAAYWDGTFQSGAEIVRSKVQSSYGAPVRVPYLDC